VLTGTVQTPQDAAKAQQLATIFVTGGEATTPQRPFFFGFSNESKIVNMLKIIGEDQVTLKVTVAEVQRSVMKQLGVNLIAGGNVANGVSFRGLSENLTGALGKPISGSGLALAGTLGSVSLTSFLNAMEASGAMKTLAEPTLTAISGQQATFRVGGDYYVVQQASFGGRAAPGQLPDGTSYNFAAEAIEYGVGLEFTPVVLSPGRISMKIRTSVSEPTFGGSQTVHNMVGETPGATLLGVRKRLADTTVELPSGGTMMIGGLLHDEVRQVVSGYPGLSKVPVLGALFRSKDFVRNETELVILVTPYLVRPVERNKLARPDDNFNPSSDAAGNLLGRVNRVYGHVDKQLPEGRYHGVVGFIYK
ncbi:MAG TPA: type II and III secretion system protein family protein, partial [Rhizobiaceae bacterium]|nr:type II and III secretion system protein family protein [Rhizobiaceae bacterium]